MDKIELMENVLNEYERIQKDIVEVMKEEKKAEISLEKEKERYEEAKSEFGDNTANEYERQVLMEFQANIKEYEQNKEKVSKEIEEIKQKKEFMATDKNIRYVTQGLKEIDRKIREKELKLRQIDMELLEYYKKGDNEKIPQDFYNEQDKIKKEIKDLMLKKEKFEKFEKLLKESKINREIEEAYREKQVQEAQEESLIEEATRKEIEEYNKQEDIEEAYREKQAQEAQEESLIEEATRKEIEEYNKQEDNNIVEEYRKKKEQGDNEIKSTKLLSIEAVKCSVKDGKIVYQIGGLDESGQPFKINKVVNPTKITKKEKREILKSTYNDKSNLKNIDIELYRILKENDQLNNTDINKQYIKFVNAMNAHVNLIDNISIEYDLNNLNKTDLTRSQKRQLKSVARKNQKNNIARYTKPQSKLQAFLNKFRQKAITAGEEQEEMSREDYVYTTYKDLRKEEGFEFDRFCEDMNLSDEERRTLMAYEKVNLAKQKFSNRVKNPVDISQVNKNIKTDEENAQQVENDTENGSIR